MIGKYVHGNRPMNEIGTQNSALELQMWSPEIKDGKSLLWGCPAWNRAIINTTGGTVTYNSAYYNGYMMNKYPLAPKDLSGGVPPQNNTNIVNLAAGVTKGRYFKQVQYTKPAERALLLESIHPYEMATYTWPFAPQGALAFPQRPTNNYSAPAFFTFDFNRHSKVAQGTKQDQPSMNLLYCDGHASTASAREAFRAVRFQLSDASCKAFKKQKAEPIGSRLFRCTPKWRQGLPQLSALSSKSAPMQAGIRPDSSLKAK
jgi:prepilin-type processing-associated H-X9-DG protein